ncbi:hypothetical protein D3C81_1714050 [compost metagenome]
MRFVARLPSPLSVNLINAMLNLGFSAINAALFLRISSSPVMVRPDLENSTALGSYKATEVSISPVSSACTRIRLRSSG